MRFFRAIKEFFRKIVVSLKRRPNNIVMIVLAISFLYYALNLTNISKTTFACSLTPMGLMSFITFLFSILSFVCWLNAFPRREKPKAVFLIVFVVLLVSVMLSDIVYIAKILERLSSETEINVDYVVAVNNTRTILIVHIISTVVVLALAALLPLYSKLLRKINTSIDVEDNGEMGEIELENDD